MLNFIAPAGYYLDFNPESLTISLIIIMFAILIWWRYDKRRKQNKEDLKKLLEKIKQVPSIEEKTKADLKDLKDFSDFQKACKLHPLGECLDMFNYGGECCEKKCPILDAIKYRNADETAEGDKQ